MQKGVLIKDAKGNVIEKRVCAGDTSNLDEQLKAEGVIYEIYDDTDDAFVSAVVVPQLTPAQVAWQKVRTDPTQAVIFLAKQLGLE